MRRLLLACTTAAGLSIVAGRSGALTRHGALAAGVVGGGTLYGAGWRGGALLGTFFVTSSALSRMGGFEGNGSAGSTARRARQVFANGGVAALAALANHFRPHPRFVAGMAGALAAAMADTWATEVGATSPTPPRLLVSRAAVSPGMSGGVTRRGTLASVVAANLLGALTAALAPSRSLRTGLAVAAGGIAGSLVDSLVGERWQELRWCVACQAHCEGNVHSCGEPTMLVGGIARLDNDVVNAIATCTGGVIAALMVGGVPRGDATAGRACTLTC